MAKNKLLRPMKKIAETVIDAYRKVETGVVSGFEKISDTFVDQFLTREGESVEEAKVRLKRENPN